MADDVKPLTVAQLIAVLQQHPQDLLVAYCLHSEQCLLEEKDIEVVKLCAHRPDGWIHDMRNDKSTVRYLVFP